MDGSDASSAAAAGDESPFYDSSRVHEITMDFDDDDYQAMLDTYTETGEKEWITATVKMDGDTYEDAGIRLKGNSSLMGLRGGGPAEDGREGENGRPVGSASGDTPEALPWLIRLDKYVDGQNHEGDTRFVVRSNNSETSLNEALALELLDAAGLASPETVAIRFSVNDSDQVLRLVVEEPHEEWMANNFDESGALYKADSGGDYSYRGDDPASYEDIFNQKAGEDNADLTPVIDFLNFINNSSDEEFTQDLDEWLDVDSFATYLAMMDLVNNFDDIDGPGNNSYLYYDTEAETFTVVPWDMNLAFGGMGGFGGGNGEPGGEPGVSGPPDNVNPEDLPEGAEPPEGFNPEDLPEGFEPPEGFNPEDLPEGSRGGEGGGGFGGMSNPLTERFHDDEDFEALYQEEIEELQAELYDSGTADDILATWVSVLTEDASGLVDDETISAEAEELSNSFS